MGQEQGLGHGSQHYLRGVSERKKLESWKRNGVPTRLALRLRAHGLPWHSSQ